MPKLSPVVGKDKNPRSNSATKPELIKKIFTIKHHRKGKKFVFKDVGSKKLEKIKDPNKPKGKPGRKPGSGIK